MTTITPSRRLLLARRILTGASLTGALLLGATLTAPGIAAQTDADGDGLFDQDETGVYFTNPQLFDTDGDGIGDGEEVYLGTNPLAANAAPVQADSDGDGLFDLDETNVYGTNAYASDTDGDGVGDGQEVYNGTNPTVSNGSIPASVQNPQQCNILFGDYEVVGCEPSVQQSSAASG